MLVAGGGGIVSGSCALASIQVPFSGTDARCSMDRTECERRRYEYAAWSPSHCHCLSLACPPSWKIEDRGSPRVDNTSSSGPHYWLQRNNTSEQICLPWELDQVRMFTEGGFSWRSCLVFSTARTTRESTWSEVQTPSPWPAIDDTDTDTGIDTDRESVQGAHPQFLSNHSCFEAPRLTRFGDRNLLSSSSTDGDGPEHRQENEHPKNENLTTSSITASH